jgi:ferredoxin-type protein NapH
MSKLGTKAINRKGWWLAYRWLILRRLSQVSILLLFLLGPWAGIYILKGNLSSSLLFNTVPMTDPMLFLQMLAAGFWGVTSAAIIGAAIVLIFYMLVGGRVFCSWVCPVNLVTDLAFWLRRKLGLTGGLVFPRATRYWLLGVVMLVAAVTGTLAYELVNPVSLLHRGLFFGMGAGWILIIGLLMFDLAVSKRGWCSHLCPMGAFYALVSPFSLIRVRAEARSACDDCGECFVVCPEPQILPPVLKGEDNGIPPVVLDGVCTNCGRCIDICHEGIFEFGLRNEKNLPDELNPYQTVHKSPI